ncbi:hypothetical protein C7S15_8400 [Burkholderia cepacia]|nr:hypothetical protein [Burkholderia cepacia]
MALAADTAAIIFFIVDLQVWAARAWRHGFRRRASAPDACSGAVYR